MNRVTSLPVLMSLAVMVLAVAAGFFCRAERADKASPCGEKEKVDWLDYDKAMTRCAKESKPVVLVFYQDHCRQCEMLDKKSFERPDIACYMNKKLLASRIHIKKEPELKKKYRVPGTPMVWFLTPEGEEIDYFVGYLKPAKVFSILHYIGDKAYKNMSYEEYREETKEE